MSVKKKVKKIRKVKETGYFDDCAVCLYMKSAEEGKKPPTFSELKNSFQKAKEKGAVVGGSMFEEDEKKN